LKGAQYPINTEKMGQKRKGETCLLKSGGCGKGTSFLGVVWAGRGMGRPEVQGKNNQNTVVTDVKKGF